ncbi:hypothetical protein [Duganella vulcania]|nr:hypothetical protein [Duganella vulcania]
MEVDKFAGESYGQIALKKIAPTDPNFRLFYAGWLGSGTEREVMAVRGQVYRRALSGPNRGRLRLPVSGTVRSVHVTAAEMRDWEATQ